MFDPIIEYFLSSINYKSDVPVVLLFSVIIIYGLSRYISRVWLILSTMIAATIILYLPIFFASPAISRFLASIGMIGEHWLIDKGMEQDIGMGFCVGILIIFTIIYLVTASIWELNLRRNPIYLLTLKKEPSHIIYIMAKSSKVDQYSKVDIAFFLDKLDITDVNYIQNYLIEESHIKTAMAWVYVGIPVRRAVTKVKLDLQNLTQDVA
ncbi:hypothetical protein [Paenibacillus periandrae]|uniref:hypothetical protein n=1 Tax=Paenibacillus periandrae TaxID=1761741 RepID=UPI001F090070|nr:hypothetical protein [Paenibacillus periandrae]